MRLFNPVTYETAMACYGQRSQLVLRNGKKYQGYVADVRPDGILFHSDNPGFLFFPFAAVALLALTVPFAAAAGYGLGRASAYRYPYPGYGAYPGYPYYY